LAGRNQYTLVGGGGNAPDPFVDGCLEKLRGDPIVGPEFRKGVKIVHRSGPEPRCRTVKKEVCALASGGWNSTAINMEDAFLQLW